MTWPTDGDSGSWAAAANDPPWPTAPAVPGEAAAAPLPAAEGPTDQTRRTKVRGRRTTVAALIGVLINGALIGVGLYSALASIDVISLRPIAAVGLWSAVAAIGLVGAFVALILSVVAVARRRSLLAVLSLVGALTLPIVAAVVGVQLGATALATNAQARLGEGGQAALESLDHWASEKGVDLGPLLEWVLASRG